MPDLFYYLGNTDVPYRDIMSRHTDFIVNNRLIPKRKVVIAEQTHSNNVHVCNESNSGAGFDEYPQIMNCDSLITNICDLYLLIRTADCTPILLYDDVLQVVGAIHSGRKGTRLNIVNRTIEAMMQTYGCIPKNIKAWIGAGVCAKHYPVSEEIWQDFYQYCDNDGFKFDKTIRPCIDIQNIIWQQLVTSGINHEMITSNNICTYESTSYFSNRRNGTKNRQINLIGLVNGKHCL
jgi:polyphenol oxidase